MDLNKKKTTESPHTHGNWKTLYSMVTCSGKKLKTLENSLKMKAYITYPNLWDTVKAVLRGKFIAISAFIKKLEKSYSSNLTAQLEALEEKEASTLKRQTWREIVKLKSEINQLVTKRLIKRINKTKS